MFIKRLVLLAGLCVLFTGCSTGGYYGDFSHDTTTRKGVRYLLGRGVSQSNEKAFYYFSKAAKEENDAFAQNEIAFMYIAGKGTNRDPKKALFWYQKAAQRGLASAQYNLGLMYIYGKGTSSNRSFGMTWIKKSADNGFAPARQFLGRS